MNMRKINRIVDANINRVTEGLRVVEDIFRFSYDDSSLQQDLKALRHRVSACVHDLPGILSRDPSGDVGLFSEGEREFMRESIADIVRSNMKRSQEGLRVLEEVLKLDSPRRAREMKIIRYDLYMVEKKIAQKMSRSLTPGLYLILTDPPSGYPDIAEKACRACIPAIQLRYKGQDSRKFLQIAQDLRGITAGSETLFIVNDRVDIAFMAKADGVHLGQDDLPPRESRSIMGEDVLIGASTHTHAQVINAQRDPVDYIGFGPIFPTTSKENLHPVTGTEGLGKAVATSRIPVVAIGGITRKNLPEVLRTSCTRIAVMSAVLESADPGEEIVHLHELIMEEI